MKRHLLLSIIAMLFSVASAFAQDCDYSGTTNELQWCLKSGTLTISGNGTIFETGPWQEYKESINSIVIHEGITTIAIFAFQNYINLTSITMPNTLLYIGIGAFQGCEVLPSIIIPNSVIEIYSAPFNNCKNLISIDVEVENNNYASENGVLLNKNKTTLICCPPGKSGEYVISESVTAIGSSAFRTCRKLTSISIHSNVVSIGGYAFGWCDMLTSFTNLNPVPVGIYSSIFSGTNINECNLRVPVGSVTAYQNANVWNEFNIVGIYSVNVSVNNEEYGTAIGSGYYEPNATATLTATAKTGYKFAHWTKNGDIVSTENPYNFTVTEDIELVANFEIYLVTVSVNNEEYGTATGGGYYEANTTAIVSATAHTGYKFKKKKKNGVEVSINNSYNFTVTEDVELVANFEEKVGVENFELITLKIYPNPTIGELRIEGGKLRIENVVIYDVFGKIQKTENWKTKNAIEISHLPTGVYFVKVFTEAGKVMRKVVKE